MKKLLSLALLTILGLAFTASGAAAAELVKIPTCWMDESPGFNIWYAKKMGWDKEEGLDIEMILFSSGPAQMEALPAKEWVLGSTGVGGQLVGGIRYKIYAVAPIVSEGKVHALYLRPDSPASKIKGYNPKYPDVMGSPETVKGMKILYTSQTTVHYMVGKWLEILGLKPEDVTLVNMEQPSAIPAFEKGIGDAVCLWSPFTFAAESRGWPVAGDMDQMDCVTVSAIVGDKDWCDKNPELVAKFLRVYFRTSKMLAEEGPSDRIVAEYQQYMNEFAGIKMSAEDAKKDIIIHPRWSYEESLALLDNSKGESQADKWQFAVADFFASVGRFSPKEVQKFKDAHINTDKFLKLVQQPIPGGKM
jgi:ABC-type nitrate/sulfonate/bicarbonate transport system substrate-binding protein